MKHLKFILLLVLSVVLICCAKRTAQEAPKDDKKVVIHKKNKPNLIKNKPTDKNIETIELIFSNYIEHNDLTDSKKDKTAIKKSIESLTTISDKKQLELLINVWMYYNPTNFSCRQQIYTVLKRNKSESIKAVHARITNKKDWETTETPPFSELKDLLQQLEKE